MLHQAIHKLLAIKVVANFDESPVSFSGEFTRFVVVNEGDTDLQFECRGSDDSKRMFTCDIDSQQCYYYCITGICHA